MTIGGGFHSGALPLVSRFAYWLVGFGLGSVVGHLVAGRLARIPWLEARPWAMATAVALVMTLPYTVVVWAVTTWIFRAPMGAVGLADLVAPVLTISVAMTLLHRLAARRPAETHAAPPGAPAPRFLDRLPPKLKGARLYAVEAQDHYLRLHTDRGSDLVLMRLADAVAELEGLEGAQTHRSWWVARDAVVTARREGGRAVLQLEGGVEAPVSRTYVKALREEGWF